MQGMQTSDASVERLKAYGCVQNMQCLPRRSVQKMPLKRKWKPLDLRHEG